jgi:hypothetical protein
MRGAIPPLPQYAFMAWFSVKAQGQLYFKMEVKVSEGFRILYKEGHRPPRKLGVWNLRGYIQKFPD